MRLFLPILAAAILLVAAACGGGEVVEAQPETVQGTVATETTETTAGGDEGGDTGGDQGGDTGGDQGGDTGGDTGGDQGGDTGGGQGGGGEQGGGEQGDATAGKQVFTSAGCGSCHTLSDAGTSGAVGPNLDEAQPSYDVAVTTVTNGRGAMPAFKDQLSEKQIQDVATYVSTAAGT
jgi:cytochrome c553